MFGPDYLEVNRITIYIPDRDCFEQEIPDICKWIDEAAYILVSIAGGATVLPGRGMYLNRITGKIINEQTALVYANVEHEHLLQNRSLITDFIDRFGRETNQDSVLVEYNGQLYFITDFERAPLAAVG
jgi:hypothetical protein